MRKEPNRVRKIKFLFLASDRYPPFRPDIAILFGKELGSRGHQIDMILQSEGGCEKAYKTKWKNLDIWVGPTDTGRSFLRRLRKHILNILHDLKIFSVLKKGNYDFIQVKDKFLTALFAIIASKIYKTKFIYWLSFSIPEAAFHKVREKTARYPFAYFIRGIFSYIILYKIIPKFSDHIFVQSDRMKKDFMVRDIPEKKMTAVPMGIYFADIPDVKNRFQDENSDYRPRLVYIGALDKARRLDFLIRIFKMVVSRHPEVILYMVGSANDPADEIFLQKEAEKLSIRDSIIFTGFLPREKVWDYVIKSDVCVSPMYPSPMLITTTPTKCIEYLGLGKPVVGNDIPDMKYVITESGGGICVQWNEEEFAEAIIYLLSHPEEAKNMGIKGRDWVLKNREYKIIADKVEDVYQKICE